MGSAISSSPQRCMSLRNMPKHMRVCRAPGDQVLVHVFGSSRRGGEALCTAFCTMDIDGSQLDGGGFRFREARSAVLFAVPEPQTSDPATAQEAHWETSLDERLFLMRRWGEVQIRFWPVAPLRKTLFLVRHAESEWNAAQAKMDMVNMFKSVDHPLSVKGLQQAQDLAQRIAQAAVTQEARQQQSRRRTKSKSSVVLGAQDRLQFEASFLTAPIFSSPLCRALQTAMVAFHESGHAALKTRGITLLAQSREVKKGVGSLDCVGKVTGPSIHFQAVESLAKAWTTLDVEAVPRGARSRQGGTNETEDTKATKEDEVAAQGEAPVADERFMEYLDLLVESGDAGNRWWTTTFEKKEDWTQRIRDLLTFIELLPEETLIICCHSYLICEIFRHLAPPLLDEEGSTEDARNSVDAGVHEDGATAPRGKKWRKKKAMRQKAQPRGTSLPSSAPSGDLVHLLSRNKLQNCGVVAASLEFSPIHCEDPAHSAASDRNLARSLSGAAALERQGSSLASEGSSPGAGAASALVPGPGAGADSSSHPSPVIEKVELLFSSTLEVKGAKAP
uniref:Uncharacterized protein n=1 Tax=Rhizochromulina marina TaxID=1034831 RepID=A0A7S2RBI2_9STRA|mmetsp:Transcript_13928/g.40804  ORF Transcript_13928/g.40804 Transcript_13928/m.40804 type:complete len:561 (+) Transcript_13928:37-1719(+)